MPITLPDTTKKAHIEAIKHYFSEERGAEIGDLQASFFLDFVIETVGPSIYNQAIKDAQAHLQNVVVDLDAVLHEPERGRL